MEMRILICINVILKAIKTNIKLSIKIRNHFAIARYKFEKGNQYQGVEVKAKPFGV